jgi:hypothetical protein
VVFLLIVFSLLEKVEEEEFFILCKTRYFEK